MNSIDEKEILRREEVDFRAVWSKLKRGWPIIIVALGFFLVLGMIFQLAFPPRYAAKTTLVIEKPRGTNDPSVIVNQESALVKIDDYYYNNQKVAFRSYPLVSKALEKIGLVRYFKSGLINQEIYKLTPFTVVLDSTYMTFKDFETPYGGDFYVNFENFDTYHLEVEGEYPVSQYEYYFEGDFRFGEWVTFDRTRFKLLPVDTLVNDKVTIVNDIFEDGFGFVLLDQNQAVLDYIDDMEITLEEIESTAFGVTLVLSAPEKQIDFLNALGEVFLEDHMEQKTGALKMAIKYLNEELDKVSARLETSEKKIETFKSDRSITSLNQEGTLLLEQTMQLESDKVNYVVKAKYYDYLEDILNNQDDYSGLISPEAFGIKDALLIQLTEELIGLQRDLNSMKRQNAESNPAYADIQARIQANRSTILNSVKGFKESNQVMLQNIDRRISEIDQSAKNIPKAERELMELERFFKLNEQLYITLMDKKSDAEISLISTGPDFRILEPGYITDMDPVMPYLPITLAVIIVLGLFFGIGYLILQWVFNDKLDTVRDVMRFTPHASIAGEVYHTNIRLPEDLENYPKSRVVNQLAGVRYHLGITQPDSKIWTVGSKNRGEGKTFFSTLMATYVARSGLRTLLIDGNFDKPELKKLFKIRMGPSLIDVAKGHAGLAEAVVPTGKSGLDLVEIGSIPFRTDRDLALIADLIRSLSDTYDQIIIDTSPFGNSTDTYFLLQLADVPIVVVRRKKTSFGDMEELDEIFQKKPFKGVEAVILDTFDPKPAFVLFRKREKSEKKSGLWARFKLLFVRI